MAKIPAMNTDDYAVEEILSDGRRFMVPLYQRKYQWHDSQIRPFWEDVEAKAIEVLDNESKFQHYMGALILAPIGESAILNKTPKVQIVDGQQRLTTFQIFLASLREVALKHGLEEIAEQVHDYLFNKLKKKDTDKLAEFKITPTPSDQELFHSILVNNYDTIRSDYRDYYWRGGVPKNTSLRALRAYDELFRFIHEFSQFGSTDINTNGTRDDETETIKDETDTLEAIETRLEALLTALLNRMKLVVITLDDNDDAQVIFETLNSKGEPLLAMDLVRNNIFYRAEQESIEIEDLYFKLWEPFDDPWWREAAPFARPKRPRIDHFLTHVLGAETGERISMRELYAEYRSFAIPKGKPRFVNVETELQLLRKYSPIYETLEGRQGEDPDLHWLGQKLAAWQVTTAYPVILQVSTSDISRDEKRKLYLFIYSYVVRRALSGLTAKNLNKVFQGISEVFLNNGPSVAVLESFFAERTGDSLRFPNDGEFRNGILVQPAYYFAPQNRIKDVLWELERASRPPYAEDIQMPGSLWTEHVLPQSWTVEWPFENGAFVERDSGDPKADKRNKLLHTIGNLTLLTDKLDIAVGNKSFLKKQAMYKRSMLFLNEWFLRQSHWYETQIHERSKYLANLAVEIWPSISKNNVS